MEAPRNPALEAAIGQDPDDAELYVVYADWLEGQGDPRAALIRAQIADEGWRPRPAKPVRKLLADHREHFLGPLATCPGNPFTWRLGFIRSAKLGDDREPCAVRVGQLCRHPSGRLLVELDAHSTDLQAVLDALADTAPPTLRTLSLGHASEQAASVRALAALRGVSSLKLRGRFTLEVLDLPMLATAHLAIPGLSSASLRAIAAAVWPRLQSLHLDLSEASGDADDLAPLFARSDLLALTHLELPGVPFADELCAQLAEAPFARQLRELSLRSTFLTDAGARALASHARAFEKLELLDVESAPLSEAGCELLRGMSIRTVRGIARYLADLYDEDYEDDW